MLLFNSVVYILEGDYGAGGKMLLHSNINPCTTLSRVKEIMKEILRI